MKNLGLLREKSKGLDHCQGGKGWGTKQARTLLLIRFERLHSSDTEPFIKFTPHGGPHAKGDQTIGQAWRNIHSTVLKGEIPSSSNWLIGESDWNLRAGGKTMTLNSFHYQTIVMRGDRAKLRTDLWVHSLKWMSFSQKSITQLAGCSIIVKTLGSYFTCKRQSS